METGEVVGLDWIGMEMEVEVEVGTYIFAGLDDSDWEGWVRRREMLEGEECSGVE